LKYEDVDHSIYLEIDDEIIGTISVKGIIIKCLAVSSEYSGVNLASLLVSEMIKYLASKNIFYYQVYTKSSNKEIFEAMNFKEIITHNEISILESKNKNIVDELNKIKKMYIIDTKVDTAAIVLNCNPFTLGHRYLIESAHFKHDQVLLFILEEDLSFFSFKDRFDLVCKGVEDFKNVIVIPSTKYLISSLTFPTYFLKQDSDVVDIQAGLDASVFKKYFMPIFGIKKRYLGSETDLVTKKYNESLKKILGDDVLEIERLKVNNEFISASIVRKKFIEKDFESLKDLVPKSTYEYLINHE
jgi:[citrate (pro-3S)-lyase] ligase